MDKERETDHCGPLQELRRLTWEGAPHNSPLREGYLVVAHDGVVTRTVGHIIAAISVTVWYRMMPTAMRTTKLNRTVIFHINFSFE